MKHVIIPAIFLCCCVSRLHANPATMPTARVPTTQSLQDISDRTIQPLVVPVGHRAVLLLFIASDCPISNSYAPTMANLCRSFEPKGVDCFTVYCDAALTSATARAHHDQFGFPCNALLDPQQQLAKIVSATCTPEAVVVGGDGLILYRGRIDDLYAGLGHKRFAATTHELKDVLEQLVAGQPVTVPWLPAIGCEIN